MKYRIVQYIYNEHVAHNFIPDFLTDEGIICCEYQNYHEAFADWGAIFSETEYDITPDGDTVSYVYALFEIPDDDDNVIITVSHGMPL